MVIHNVKITDITGERYADVTIEDKTITHIQPISKPTGEKASLQIIPSLVDLNVRLKDDALNGETLEELAHNACVGGVHEIVLNPESNPPIDNEIALEFIQSHNRYLDGAKCHSLVNGTNTNKELTNMAILLKRGAVAPFMSTKTDNILATKIAQYAKMYNVTLFCRAEDRSMSQDGFMYDGEVSSQLGLAGISPIGELLHVSRMIEIARYYGIKVLFQSIASPKSIELITKAKKEGVDVKCEVSIHHLLHSDRLCENFNTTAKLYPPLAPKEDMLLMQKALQNGEIDILTALHRPASPVNKEVAFADAAYGCDAISESFSLYYTKLVKSKLLSLQDVIRLCSVNPAKVIGKETGSVHVGMNNFLLFDAEKSFCVDNEQSLYNQETLFGTIRECQ
jgi:dihydroorotase